MKLPISQVTVPTGVLLAAKALAATSGEFNVLTMNVAGLPDFLNNNEVPGDKATNSGLIGSKFAEYGYDIIHTQEVRSCLSTILNTKSVPPTHPKHEILLYIYIKTWILRTSTTTRTSTRPTRTPTARRRPGACRSATA